MPTGKLVCPNPECKQKHLVVDTDELTCSTCGTHIVQVQKHIDREERRQKRQRFFARLHLPLLGSFAVAGFVFHEINRTAVPAFVMFVGIAIFSWIRKNGLARGWTLAAIATLVFFLASLVGDMAMPPAALCADGTYSYSAHHRGTCSWHGGVDEWYPPPWWQ